MNSLFTFITSSELIDEIPVILNVVAVLLILNSKSDVIGVNAIGDCMTPSIDINAFSFFLNISKLWLPEPVDVNATFAPDNALARDVASCRVSLLFLIA